MSARATTVVHAEGRANETDLPFTYSAHREVIVPAFVNQAGPYPFILDTGSSHTSVSLTLAEQLGAKAAATTTVSTLAGDQQCEVVHLEQVAIGPMSTESVLATAVPQDVLDASGIAQGVIGQDLLGSARYTVDFRNRRVIWGAASPATAMTLPLRPTQGIYLVDLPQRNVTLRLIPDSGAEGLVLFRREPLNLPDFQLAPGLSWISTVTNRIPVRHITLPELRIGAEARLNQPAYLVDDPRDQGFADGVLPLHIFDRVNFDAPRGVVAFEMARH